METIKNYLETMFANMPNTPEVINAKRELLQMMEDKYNELLAEGKSENEAVGQVISEFGNINDIAEELGLDKKGYETMENGFSQNNSGNNSSSYNNGQIIRRHVTMDEVKSYFKSEASRGILVGLGVFFCIISVIMPIIGDAIKYEVTSKAVTEGLFVSMMFVVIAIGVALFIIAGTKGSKWKFLKKEACYIDYSTAEYVKNERERYKILHTIMLVGGIVLCILCIVPPIMASNIKMFVGGAINSDDLSAAAMFVIVATGVFLIVVSNILQGRYDRVLKLNNSEGISSPVNNGKSGVYYDNKSLGIIMSLYWPIITCVYMLWSFLTFRWYITWIIWPIAGIIHKIIESNLGKKNDGQYHEDYSKITAPYRVIITIVTIGVILLGVFGRFTFNLPFGINFGGGLFGGKMVSDSIKVDEYKNISLDLDVGDVSFETGNEYMVKYSYPEDMVPAIVSKNGTLTISTKKDSMNFFDFFGKEFKVTIILPKDAVMDSFTADLNMGNIEFSGIDVNGKTFIDADMGNVSLADMTMGSFECDANMGNVALSSVKADSVVIEADMGNIEVSGDVADIKADCSMGNVEFNQNPENKDAHIELETDLGEVSFNGRDCGTKFFN